MLVVGCGNSKRKLGPEPVVDETAWEAVDGGPPPKAAVDEAVARVRATALEIERVAADGRLHAAKPRCELALSVAADEIEASDRADAKALLAKLAAACDQRVFPAALSADLEAVQRFAKAGDIQGVRFVCTKDRVIHERSKDRKDAPAFAAACADAWIAPLPGPPRPR